MSLTSKRAQVKEIVRCGKDPVYFFNRYLKIQHPTKGSIPFKTFPFQDDCVSDFVDHRFNIILKSRQLGISTITAAYAVWLACFYKDKNILVIATKLAVAQNFIKKVKTAIRSMPEWLLMSEIIGNNKQTVEFSNGSTIKAVPTSDDAGRSEALSLLIVDEAAFIRNFDELWTSLYPTLSTGGRAIVLSTPNGVGGQYHDLWLKAESGESLFNAIKLPWDVHPDHDQEWFEKECKNFSRKQIAQELLCDFAASGETFLNHSDIEHIGARIKTPIEKWGPGMGVWTWKYPLTEHKYIVSADVARGDAADYSAFHVIDVDESEIVAEFKGKIPPDEFAILLNEVGRRYSDALLCPENNTYGYALVMKLCELGYKNLYYQNPKDKISAMYGLSDVPISKIGFTTSGQSRNQILTKLEQVIRNKEITIYSSRLYEELKTFMWKGNKAQAQKGKNDDLVMSLAIGVWLYETSPVASRSTHDLNKEMLKAFGVNGSNAKDTSLSPFHHKAYNPFKRYKSEAVPFASGSAMSDFGWLI